MTKFNEIYSKFFKYTNISPKIPKKLLLSYIYQKLYLKRMKRFHNRWNFIRKNTLNVQFYSLYFFNLRVDEMYILFFPLLFQNIKVIQHFLHTILQWEGNTPQNQRKYAQHHQKLHCLAPKQHCVAPNWLVTRHYRAVRKSNFLSSKYVFEFPITKGLINLYVISAQKIKVGCQ